jgi:hypothetical protein
MGRFGDDFLRRAADWSLAGVTANNPAEAVYLMNFRDADRARFEPDGSYQLRINARRTAARERVWPLPAYTAADLIPTWRNPNLANRYSGRRHDPDLTMDQDGGLRLDLQSEPPATGHEANWLPTSGAHPWFLILRLYRPQPTVIDAAWGVSSDHPRDLNLNKAPAPNPQAE